MPHVTSSSVPTATRRPSAAVTTRQRHRRAWLGAALAGAAALLTGCATPGDGVAIDTRYRAQAQDSRVLFLVLHYTGGTLARALQALTGPEVSAHYLVSDESPPVVYQLVDESRRAWHAGDSAWQGHSLLNASSIGIELVNPGPLADGRFAPFAAAQIDALIPLVRAIVARHGIRPERVLGHSDIAPQRKIDPGPAFPWQRLAEAGLVAWPAPAQVAAQQAGFAAALPDTAWFQQALARIGYRVPEHGSLDPATRRVLAAFQMKYRPARHDGQPDAETAALLQVLLAPALPPLPPLPPMSAIAPIPAPPAPQGPPAVR